jgi:hypothetical protein
LNPVRSDRDERIGGVLSCHFLLSNIDRPTP